MWHPRTPRMQLPGSGATSPGYNPEVRRNPGRSVTDAYLHREQAKALTAATVAVPARFGVLSAG